MNIVVSERWFVVGSTEGARCGRAAPGILGRCAVGSRRAGTAAATATESAATAAAAAGLVDLGGRVAQRGSDLVDLDLDAARKIVEVNAIGALAWVQAAHRAWMGEHGGSVVNISSVSAHAVSTNRGDYCVAKAGLGMVTKLFAARLADHGINVYEVCPGVIASDMTAPVREKYDKLIADGLTPIRRWGEPSDVGKAVVALARDYFPFTTGEVFNVDGGFNVRKL